MLKRCLLAFRHRGLARYLVGTGNMVVTWAFHMYVEGRHAKGGVNWRLSLRGASGSRIRSRHHPRLGYEATGAHGVLRQDVSVNSSNWEIPRKL